mgnify:CR=1 FL=1
MLADAHRKAAEDIEKTILTLQTAPYAARLVIEGAWGTAFHWIAFSCEIKHQSHQDGEARLQAFLRRQGEEVVGDWWENLEHVRQDGWYGENTGPPFVQHALDLLERVREWASQ